MNKNNKGMTLVEIIISVALISIVIIFLLTLLIQVNNENSDNEVKSSYLVNQSTFIKQIEEDFLDYGLNNGETCIISNINKSGITETNSDNLYLKYLDGNPKIHSHSSTDGNIKCLKFNFDDPEYNYAYLFLYKQKINDVKKTILAYYRGDFKQSIELEEFDWTINNYTVFAEYASYGNGASAYIYSLPIIGPDYNDYSINLSYGKIAS